MTQREAFILGVGTYCKTAEMDSADAIAFVELLLSSPGHGAAIIKRAQVDPALQELLKAAWTWRGAGETIGGIGGGIGGWLGGGALAAGTGGVGALAAPTLGAVGSAAGERLGGWVGGMFDPAEDNVGAEAAAGSDANDIEFTDLAAGGAGGAQAAAQQQWTPSFDARTTKWLQAQGFDPATAQQGRGGQAPAFTRVMAPGGKNVGSGSVPMLGRAAAGGDGAAGLPTIPKAFQGKYLAGLTGLTDKQFAQFGDQANQRRMTGRALKRSLRQLGLSGVDVESMTPEQMQGANYSPETKAVIRAAQKYRGEQRSAAGGRGFSQWGGGFSGAPRPTGPTGSTPAPAPQQAAAESKPMPSSSPPTESQIGNMPTQSLTDPSVNPDAAPYKGPRWSNTATNAPAMRQRQQVATQALQRQAEQRPELLETAPEHFQQTGSSLQSAGSAQSKQPGAIPTTQAPAPTAAPATTPSSAPVAPTTSAAAQPARPSSAPAMAAAAMPRPPTSLLSGPNSLVQRQAATA